MWGPVFVQDLDRGRRKATLEDYANIMKICQAGEHIHLNGTIPVDPSDVDPEKKASSHALRNRKKIRIKPLIGFCFDKEKVLQNFDDAGYDFRWKGFCGWPSSRQVFWLIP